MECALASEVVDAVVDCAAPLIKAVFSGDKAAVEEALDKKVPAGLVR